MRTLLSAAALLMVSTAAYAGSTHVQGHFRSDGTYVQPHYRSNPNTSTYDNWSVKPNVNPYTGQAGTRNPYGSFSGSGSGRGVNDLSGRMR